MVIYEVNLNVDKDVADEYAPWLSEHIAEMLEIDGFISAEWLVRDAAFEVDTPANQALWSVRYSLVDRQALTDYLEVHAPRMRGDGLKRFEGKFTATRRVLTQKGKS